MHLRIWSLVMAALMLAACGTDTEAPAEAGADRSQETFRWTLVTTWPRNLPAVGTAPERLAEKVKVMSNGRLQIRVYGAGELVPAFEVFDAVAEGTAEMGHGAAYYWRGKIPIAAIFTSVPFGMTAQETNGWLHYGGGLELWQELYEPHGLVPLASGNTGTQMGGWFNKEINSVSDLRGLRIRIPGLGGDVYQRAGSTSVSLPGGEVYTSMQTGVIDATEWIGPYNDLALGLHRVGRYFYYPGWQEPSATLEAIVNKDAWDSLPDDLKLILKTATRAINQDMLDEFTARNAQALKTMVDEHGVELRRFPDDVLNAFREHSFAVLEDAAGRDDISQRIYDSYMSFLRDAQEYARFSEQAMMNVRQPPDDQ